MKVESFKIDHRTLLQGIYLRKSGKHYNIYDIRMYKPLADGELENAELNGGYADNERFLSPKTAHALEHLLAFNIRDTLGLDEQIIYIGVMGCLTGFYILTIPSFRESDLYSALKKSLKIVIKTDSIPAATAIECGNYSYTDLSGAKKVAFMLLNTIFKDENDELPVIELVTKYRKNFTI